MVWKLGRMRSKCADLDEMKFLIPFVFARGLWVDVRDGSSTTTGLAQHVPKESTTVYEHVCFR